MTVEMPEVLTTLRADGSRAWLKPRVSSGRYLFRRRLVAYFLMALFFALPFVTINHKPAILLDITQRRFTLFGYTFLPTDTVLLALLMLSIFVTIFLFTALFGRLWCGWACPQTVYLEFLYRPLERLFDSTIGRGGIPRANLPGWRRPAYFIVAFFASLIPAHTFLAYFVGVENLRHWILTSPSEHPVPFLIMLIVTLGMLFDFYWFREQLCIVACPYGRFQSALLDSYSTIVCYDKKRGEPRGRGGRGGKPDIALPLAPDSQPRGDCIDCHLCVATCPTGIDIRKGLQLECVNCTQCIDACDAVMDKIKKPRGLIRYSSQAAIEKGDRRWFRPRVLFYPTLLTGLLTLLTILFVNKGAADVLVTRTAGNPFTALPNGQISNSVRVKITNRTDTDTAYTFSIAGTDKARVVSSENPLPVPAGASRTEPFIVTADPSLLAHGDVNVMLRVHDDKGFDRQFPIRLLGPGNTFSFGATAP